MYKLSIYNNYYKVENNDYCYNSMSGELIRLNDEGMDFLTRIISMPAEKDYKDLQYLIEKGFLVNDMMDEYAKYNAGKKELLYSRQSEVVSYVIAVTTKCNYKCTYCYEKGCRYGTLSEEKAYEIVNFIIDEAKSNKLMKVLNVTWFGGEPLLAYNIIQLIGEKLKEFSEKSEIELRTNIITNGYFLDENMLQMLDEYNLTSVQITMDGDREKYNELKVPPESGAFDKVFDNLALCSQSHKVTLRLNCNKTNIDSLYRLVKKCANSSSGINIKNVQFAIARLEGENVSDELNLEEFSDYKLKFLLYLQELGLNYQVKEYLPKPRAVPCGLLKRTNFVIDNDGYLYKCEHFVGKPQYSVGNVRSGLLYTASQQMLEELDFNEKCKTCSILPICRGGCTQKRYMGVSSVSCDSKKKEIKIIIELIIRGLAI